MTTFAGQNGCAIYSMVAKNFYIKTIPKYVKESWSNYKTYPKTSVILHVLLFLNSKTTCWTLQIAQNYNLHNINIILYLSYVIKILD